MWHASDVNEKQCMLGIAHNLWVRAWGEGSDFERGGGALFCGITILRAKEVKTYQIVNLGIMGHFILSRRGSHFIHLFY